MIKQFSDAVYFLRYIDKQTELNAFDLIRYVISTSKRERHQFSRVREILDSEELEKYSSDRIKLIDYEIESKYSMLDENDKKAISIMILECTVFEGMDIRLYECYNYVMDSEEGDVYFNCIELELVPSYEQLN
jgi:hypothetical protein